MNKLAVKIFLCFSFVAAFIAVILMGINFFGFTVIGFDMGKTRGYASPKAVLERVEDKLYRAEGGFALNGDIAMPEDYWCVLLDDSGDIVWSQNRPDDIPVHYSLNDIARLTRWYLNDYPVYVRTSEYGLIIVGIPKDSVGKYNIDYSMEWFNSLFQNIFILFIINLAMAMVMSLFLGMNIYRGMRKTANGISDLRDEKNVYIKEKGLFKELYKNLNETSRVIQRKNSRLSIRDSARKNWVSGISHDIRTPLAILMGNAEAIEQDEAASDECRQRAGAIVRQSMRIKRLVEDLNLVSSLEYDMQPESKKPVKICPLIRGIVTDILNDGMSGNAEINLELQFEGAVVMGDEAMLERAVFNLINNALIHNSQGCVINVREYRKNDRVEIIVSDNGVGVPEDILKHLETIPNTMHGIGLPLVWRIAYVHGGSFEGYNEGGFNGKIILPL